MAEAVRHAIETGEHLAVQAGTGTGKSLAYLVPAVRHAMTTGHTVVVATATIALQRQLIDRDLPRLAAALAPLLGREPTFAILKGTAQLPVPAPAARRRGGRPAGRVVRPGRHWPRLAAGPPGEAAARMGRGHGDRRPGRARPRRAGSGLAPGLGQRAGVHRRAALPVRLAVLRRAGAGRRGQGRHRGDQPRAARDRRDVRHRRAARARRGDRRRGARPGGPRHLGHRGRAVGTRGRRGRPPRRAPDRVRRRRGRRGGRGRAAARGGGRAHRGSRRRVGRPDGLTCRHAGRHADLGTRCGRRVRGRHPGQRDRPGGREPGADGGGPDDPGLAG